MNGWIKLHRAVIENEIFSRDLTAWHVFEVLLIMADSKTGKWSGGRYQLAEYCNMNPNTVKSAVERLVAQQMVTTSSTTKYTTFSICNFKKYQNSSPASTPTKHQRNTTLTRNKEIKNIDKSIAKAEYGNADINEAFEFWEQATGLKIQSQTTKNRYAATNLIKKHGLDGVRRLVQGVALAHQDKFAPRIADFIQLQAKQNELILWGKQQTKSNVEVIS